MARLSLKEFREFIRNLNLAQLHALKMMEWSRLSQDERIVVREEAARRLRFSSREERESQGGQFLNEITYDITDDDEYVDTD